MIRSNDQNQNDKMANHPGFYIRAQVLDPLGLSVTEAAEVLHVSRPALSNLVNGRAALSAEMALRLEKAFGLVVEDLMEMQLRFDIAQTRKRAGEIDIKPFIKKPARHHQERLF